MSFESPLTSPQRPTPLAVRLAGQRLLEYATEHGVPNESALLEIEIPEQDWQAARDQALLAWFIGLTVS